MSYIAGISISVSILFQSLKMQTTFAFRSERMCRDFVKQSRVAITTLLFLASAQATQPMLRSAIIWKYSHWLINKIPKWESFFFLFSAIKWQGGGGGWGVLVVAMCWQRSTLMYTVHGGFNFPPHFHYQNEKPSQSELLFHEIIILKTLLVDRITLSFLVLKMGRGTLFINYYLAFFSAVSPPTSAGRNAVEVV